MRGKNKLKRLLPALLAAALLAGALCQAGAAAQYTDLPVSHWAYDDIMAASDRGFVDGVGGGRFEPDRELTYVEFAAMLVKAFYADEVGSAAGAPWYQPYMEAARQRSVLAGTQVAYPSSWADVGMTKINRYEMAVIVANAMDSVMMENTVEISSPELAITDYSSVPSGYRGYVEQAYGKGVITGFTDGSFAGDETLTRAQAAMAVYRLLWNNERVVPDFDYTVIEKEEPTAPEIVPSGTPFATYVQENGLLNAYGRPTAALCEMLFGSEYKTYFTSASDAAGFIVDVEVPIWRINSSDAKYATTAWLQVHKLVADDVVGIFTAIFNDPEQFPIQSVGGARYSDTLRHSWGCAIDINPTQNAYGYYSGGSLVCSVGDGWWPGTNQYSITADGSVVRAFKAYGWGWGGQGYSSGWYDYMHFSIMPSGG